MPGPNPGRREEQARALEAVFQALKLSAPLLASDPRHLAGQLTGRLVGSPEGDVDRLLGDVKERAPRPWLCPLTPALAQSGGPLEQVLVGHAGSVRSVAVTTDGAWIVSGGDDHTVRIWDLASGRLERTLEGHTGSVNSVAVAPDGARIFSGGDDHTVRIWDLASGRLELTLEGHTGPVGDVGVTTDGRRLVSSGRDSSVRVWDPLSGQEIASWPLDPGIDVLASCAMPTDPSLILYVDSADGVHVLRLLEESA